MKRRYCLWLCFPSLMFVSLAQANLVTFDDVATSAGWGTVPSSYAGLEWIDWEVEENADYRSTYHNSYSFPTNPKAAFNASGVMTVTTNGQPFRFYGAQVSTWAWYNALTTYSSRSITVTGYRNDVLVGTSSVSALPTNGFTTLQGIAGTVDKLVFRNDGTEGRWWLLDNFEYAAVPAPGAALLVAIGVGLVGWAKRRFA